MSLHKEETNARHVCEMLWQDFETKLARIGEMGVELVKRMEGLDDRKSSLEEDEAHFISGFGNELRNEGGGVGCKAKAAIAGLRNQGGGVGLQGKSCDRRRLLHWPSPLRFSNMKTFRCSKRLFHGPRSLTVAGADENNGSSN